MSGASPPPPGDFVFVHSNRRIVSAWGGLGRLGELAREHGCTRAALVLDGYFRGGAMADRVEGLLRAGGCAVAAVHFVPPHEPDVGSIEACAAALRDAAPDLVVALGGGSAMDTAKIARLLLANPQPAAAAAGFGKRFAPHASVLVAVPTTAGTGSEVSESAVAGIEGSDVKLIYRSPEMTPHVALLDASLGVSAPAGVTAASGYDAVTHAVEAFVSKAASPMTDPLAESAMRLLGRWLEVAVREPADPRARSACLIASCQAAIAFNSANLGLAHAVSGPLGALHHVGHGLANAVALPAVAAFNEPAIGDKAAVIAQCFGAGGAGGAAQALARLRHAIGLDRGLDEFVPDAAARERLAQAAMRSGQVRMNPRAATIDDMRALLEAMRRPAGADAPTLHGIPAP